MKHLISIARWCLFAFLITPTLATASLLGVAPTNPRVGLINDPAGTPSTYTYNSATSTGSFNILSQASGYFDTGVAVFILPNGDGVRTLNLDIIVDDTGAFVMDQNGPDLVIHGVIDLNFNFIADSGEPGTAVDPVTGVLPILTAETIDFGFLNSTSPTDRFDFLLSVTSSQVPGLPVGAVIGYAMQAENSTFNGDFTTDFQTQAKGDIGTVGALGDYVWLDQDADGIQNDGETGVNGVTVNLLANPDGDGTCSSDDESASLDDQGLPITTMTGPHPVTGAPGFYLFANLDAGDYCVEFVEPVGLSFTTPGVSSNEADSNADITTGRSGNVDLAQGETNLTIDAGLISLATLGDYVWEDLNGDGVQNDGNTGVNGVEVLLISNPDGDASCASAVPDESVVSTTFTTNNPSTGNPGYYLFADLQPGDYCVQFVLPAGFVGYTGQDLGGDDAADSDADPANGTTGNINLVSGETDLKVDAGLVNPTSLGDYVWKDENENGVQDIGEPGIPGVVVQLLDCSGNDVHDFNGNPVAATLTGPDGEYAFFNLAPGSYTVKFTAPDGFIFATANAGEFGGIDVANDSDAESVMGDMGTTTCIELKSGDNNPATIDNPDIDAGLVDVRSQLGDFVWVDTNANGIQDANELGNGIEGVNVELLYCSRIPVLDSAGNTVTATTDINGLYLFDNLLPGTYKIRFDLDSPALTDYFVSPRHVGGIALDSDADDVSGESDCISLAPQESNLTIDAGFYRLASLGDYVWLDADADGIQDFNETGVANLTVQLLNCSDSPILDGSGNPLTTYTGFSGEYRFDELTPGNYKVKFITDGSQGFTIPGANPDDTIDSDVTDIMGSMGTTDCIELGSGDGDPLSIDNPNIDAGLISLAQCDLTVNATCAIMQQTSSNFVCKDAKPIDTLQMTWNGQDNVTVVAYYGKVDGGSVLATVSSVNNGDSVSVSGYSGAPNDNEWEVFDENDIQIGISRFHISCSDSGMNGPEDCGLPQGNSKDDDPVFLNEWLLEGLVGSNGVALQCSPPAPVAGAEACMFETPAGPHCTSKPFALGLRYLGGACTISNAQGGSAECLVGGTAGEPVRIRVTNDKGSKVFLDTGVANVTPGDVVYASAANASENDFDSKSVVEIYSATNNLLQAVEFHTSCSQPLNLGDRFGAVDIVSIDTKEGESYTAGAEVVFEYTVVNNSIEAFVDEASDSFGALGSLNLAANGGTAVLSRTQFVLPTTGDVFTNTFSVSGNLSPSGIACSLQDSVPVIRVAPPAPQLTCSDIKPVTQLSMVWNGENDVDILTEAGQLFSDVQTGNLITFNAAGLGNDVELTITNSAGEVSNAKFHVSCSDSNMNGPEDCPIPQGNGKDNDSNFSNDFLLEALIGDSGSFTCNQPNTGTVDPEQGSGGLAATCSDIKPITQLGMVWNGASGVDVTTEGGQFFDDVQNGNLIVFDTAGLGNDVELTLSGNVTGTSKFHVSCSDKAMNGSEDCGLAQGNSKRNESGLVNDWLFESMTGATNSFACSLPTTGEVPATASSGSTDLITLVKSEVKDKKLKFELENNGLSDLVITSVQVLWPLAAEELKKMKFAGDFAKDIGSTSGLTDVPTDKAFEKDSKKRKIKDGDKKKLEIEFSRSIEELGLGVSNFSVRVEFNDGTVFESGTF